MLTGPQVSTISAVLFRAVSGTAEVLGTFPTTDCFDALSKGYRVSGTQLLLLVHNCHLILKDVQLMRK